MRKFFLFWVIAVMAVGTYSQQSNGSISGLVMVNDKPIADATVTLTDKYGKVTSVKVDADGRYSFTGLKAGKYSIFGSSGMNRTGRQVEVSSGQQLTLDLDLILDARRTYLGSIKEFVTISADAAQTVETVSKTVSLIGGQEMRDRADIALADTLRTIPGFRVQQLGGFGRTASVKSRGLRNQDTALLIDGMRFRDPGSITGDATPFLSDITLTSVSRVEVLRGPGSSLYGTNAIGGTIDFQTPTPEAGWHGQVSGAAGSLGMGRFRGNVSKGLDSGKFGFTAGVARTVFTKGIDGNDDSANTNLQTRVEVVPTASTSISSRMFFSDAFVKLNTGPDTLGSVPASAAIIIDAVAGVNFVPDVDDPDNTQRSRFFNGQLLLKHSFNNKIVAQASYQGLATRRKNTNGPLGVRSQPFSGAAETDIFRGQIHTVNGQLSWAPREGFRTTAGYEFERETFENEHTTINLGDNFSVKAVQAGHTFFAQQLAAFWDNRVQLSGAFRIQTFGLNSPKFTPVDNPTYEGLVLENSPTAYTGDASASYFHRQTNTKFRAHVGNGYRVPSLYERFGSFYSEQFQYSTSGNPFLRPERSTGFDVGVDQTMLAGKVRLSGTYFYTDVSRSIDFGFCVPQCLPGPDPLGRFSGYYNSRGRVVRGLEASVEVKPTSSTSVFTSYTFTNSDERNPFNLAIPTSPGVPAHSLSAVVTQRFGKGFWVSADLIATSNYLFPFFNFDLNTFESRYLMYRFQGNRRMDLTAGYAFTADKGRYKMRVFGTVENLVADDYFENGFRTIGRTARAGMSFGF